MTSCFFVHAHRPQSVILYQLTFSGPLMPFSRVLERCSPLSPGLMFSRPIFFSSSSLLNECDRNTPLRLIPRKFLPCRRRFSRYHRLIRGNSMITEYEFLLGVFLIFSPFFPLPSLLPSRMIRLHQFFLLLETSCGPVRRVQINSHQRIPSPNPLFVIV